MFGGPIGRSYRKVFAAGIWSCWPGRARTACGTPRQCKHAIVTPDDLKGLKMRVPQSNVMLAAFKALGVDAASLPFPQVSRRC